MVADLITQLVFISRRTYIVPTILPAYIALHQHFVDLQSNNVRQQDANEGNSYT